jgi:hypothetical protein
MGADRGKVSLAIVLPDHPALPSNNVTKIND